MFHFKVYYRINTLIFNYTRKLARIFTPNEINKIAPCSHNDVNYLSILCAVQNKINIPSLEVIIIVVNLKGYF